MEYFIIGYNSVGNPLKPIHSFNGLFTDVVIISGKDIKDALKRNFNFDFVRLTGNDINSWNNGILSINKVSYDNGILRYKGKRVTTYWYGVK